MNANTGRSLQHAIFYLLVFTAIASATESGGRRWHEATSDAPWKGQKLLILENDLVSVALVPQAGGRVVSYVDQATGINHLHEEADLEAEEAGGIWDKEGVWPTANISNHAFTYKVEQAPAYLEATFEAELGNLRITKKYRLDSHTSRLALEATYQNIGSTAIRCLFTHVFSLAPGGTAGNEDFVVYPEGDGLTKKRFGSKLPINPGSVSPSWWMASDSERGESLLFTIEPNPLLAERVIGSMEGALELELHTRRHLTNPGEALSLRWDMRLIKQGNEAAQACAEGCLLPESERSAMTQSLAPLVGNLGVVSHDLGEHLLVFPWGFASLAVAHRVAPAGEPLQVSLRALRLSDEGNSTAPSETLRLLLDGSPSGEFSFGQLEPGAALARYRRIPTSNLANGSHSLELTLAGRAIKASFAVIDTASVASRIELVQKKTAELARQARQSGDASHISQAASCEMRAEDARRKFILGPAFEEWGNKAFDVDVNKLPLKLNAETRPADVDYILRVLAEAESWTETLAAGRDPFQGRKGLFEKAFYSKVDGSLQPYTVFVPQGYDGNTTQPLLLLLHGSGGDQWEIPQAAANLDGRSVFRGALEERIQEPTFLLCAPLARGPSGYEQIAEVDVLQTLEEVERDYRVDPDRVYATGWSMGGSGSYLMGLRFTDRFAAVMPIAGSLDTPLIGNTSHLPVWNFHELGDTEVSPGFTNVATSAFRAQGLPYHEGSREKVFVFSPWSDHWVGYRMSGSLDEIARILGNYRRTSFPKEVTFTTFELRHNHSYWVRIDSFDRYYEPASVKARVEGNNIDITSTNVRALTLFLSPQLVNMSGTVHVKQNGKEIFAGKAQGELRVGAQAASGLHKEHGLSGPLSDIFYEPFLIVYGTQGEDKLAADAARREAEAIRRKGLRGLRFYGVEVKSDAEVTPADVQDYHLLLVGTSKSNLLLGRIQNQLPVRVEGGAVVVGDSRFAGEDVGFRLIYPNPLNSHKYVVVCSAVSPKGLEWLAYLPSPNHGWTARVAEPDLVVIDHRASDLYPRYLASLTFDNNWQVGDRGPVVGRVENALLRVGLECSWGDFRADAVREAAHADLALVEVDDHLYPQELRVGSLTHADLSMANNFLSIYTFQATGAELREALEHAVERYVRSVSQLEEKFRSGDFSATWYTATRRPLAVSGFSYSFHRSRPQGDRVEVSGLNPEKLYRVAITERVLSQSVDGGGGLGYLGWLPEIEPIALSETDAQEQYLKTHRPAAPSTGDRITEY